MTDGAAFVWFWARRLPERRGQLFHVLCRGRMNACLIQFQDGARYVTSRNALRRAARARPPRPWPSPLPPAE